jgi:glycine/D-amino acid oxidase-like deaminating enzyme/nitrite reductase/ring-hydroxylating ferredoxin subunit
MSKKYFYTGAIWSDTAPEATRFMPLSSNEEADVAIVGGGITGISAAWNLKKSGLKVIVLESKEIGMGTTGSSTGNLYIPTGQFRTILSKHGLEGLSAVVSARSKALMFVEERIKEFNIDCGFKKVPWFYFSTKHRGSKEIEKEYEAITQSGLIPLKSVPDGFPFEVKSVVQVDMQAQFNPLQYVRKIAASINGENCRIYSGTKVTEIMDGDPCIITTSGGTIRAKKVIQATHTPKGIYAVHAMMEVYREYAIAARLKNPMPDDAIYWALNGRNKYSVRTYSYGPETYLIVIGDTQKAGQKEKTEQSFKKLVKYARSSFNIDEISFMWAAQKYTPADYLPYIGTSPAEKNIYIATGFSSDGLIYGTAASMIISDLITGKDNPLASVFNPKRLTVGASAKKAIKENVTVVKHLISDYVFRGNEKELSEIKKNESKIVDFNGQKVAAHKDEVEKFHLVSAQCPHMGCIVHWNNGEKTWDCPCHGSRFSVEGKVLEGPAIGDLTRFSS